jgi:hypothetical protein
VVRVVRKDFANHSAADLDTSREACRAKRWPRTDGLGMTRRTRDILQRLADEQPVLGTS